MSDFDDLVFRIDVDYPYPGRWKSFFYTFAGLKYGSDYQKNSKILANMFNSSSKRIKCYWFFTYKALPDSELLFLLDNPKHETCLHVVKCASKEKRILEKTVGKDVRFYNIHGVANVFAHIIWKKWKLKIENLDMDFFDEPKVSIDMLCGENDLETVLSKVSEGLDSKKVLHIHPDWLFQSGTYNPRGRYFDVLETILS